MLLSVCFNEMAPFGSYAAFIEQARAVGLVTGMAEMEVSPQEEIASPQDMKVLVVERHGFPEDFVPFHALCGVRSSPLVFAPNRAIVWGPLQWQAPLETLCFRFAFS